MQRGWRSSLPTRLMLLGLAPLVVALPIMTWALWLGSDWIIENQLRSTLRVKLVGAENYLAQLRTNARHQVADSARIPQLQALLSRGASQKELAVVLDSIASGRGLSFLAIAQPDGRVIASSSDIRAGERLWDTHVLRQAGIGMSASEFELIDARELARLSPRLAREAGADAGGGSVMMIDAAAHLPLSATRPNAILVAGLLLNGDTALADRIREIVFPAQGRSQQGSHVAIHAGTAVVAHSRVGTQAGTGLHALQPETITSEVLGQGKTWIGQISRDGISYTAAFSPIQDGEGARIGMLGVALPDRATRDQAVFVALVIAAVLAAAMVMTSVVFLRVGRGLASRIVALNETTNAVRSGDRDARARLESNTDELGNLAANFDHLLDEITQRDDALRRSNDELRRHRDHLDELVQDRTRQLAAARDAAESANRAKTALLANVSHELRTPLNHISGFGQLLASEITERNQREYAQTIVTASNQLLGLVNTLLDTARLESEAIELQLTDFDLRQVVERAVARHRGQAARKDIRLIVAVDASMPERLVGDPIRLGQVLHHLVENAVKFSDHGQVVLRVVGQHNPGGRIDLRFEVEDQGPGVHEDQRPRLFKPFELGDASSTRRHGGAGVGLAHAARLVGLMAGEIGMQPASDGGSVFWFTVPLTVAAAVQTPMPPIDPASPAAEAAAERMTALLREDDLRAREEWEVARPLLSRLLGNREAAFDAALRRYDLAEAFEILASRRQRPD